MHAVVLAGGPVGRDIPLQEMLPRPFWPILMEPIILKGIRHMVEGGVRTLTVCANGRTGLYADHLHQDPLGLAELEFSDDALPRGPAGCIKDAVHVRGSGSFLIANAACWFSDSVEDMLRQHRQQRNALTVFCMEGSSAPCGLYLCEKAVLRFIPDAGYYDIKEQLIPRLRSEGLKVGVGQLSGLTHEVIDPASYLDLHHRTLSEGERPSNGTAVGTYREHSPGIWIASSARVARSARLYAPVIIGPRAQIGEDAIVVGPSTVGAEAVIDAHAVVVMCAVWPAAHVAAHTTVEECVIAPEKLNGSQPIDLLTTCAAGLPA